VQPVKVELLSHRVTLSMHVGNDGVQSPLDVHGRVQSIRGGLVQRVPPCARLAQWEQFASQSSAQLAQVPAALHPRTVEAPNGESGMPVQQTPLQHTCGVGQPVPAWPFSPRTTPQLPVPASQVSQVGQVAGHTAGGGGGGDVMTVVGGVGGGEDVLRRCLGFLCRLATAASCPNQFATTRLATPRKKPRREPTVTDASDCDQRSNVFCSIDSPSHGAGSGRGSHRVWTRVEIRLSV
jgi:hypothetical protein